MIGVEKDKIWNSDVTTGIGRIVIPFGVDRDLFVEDCYRKERVCIVVENGGTLVKNCYIDSSILQSIKFPKSYREFGSRIAFIMNSFDVTPIIVANISNLTDRNISGEESFSIQRAFNNGILSISGTGDGKLLINLSGTDGAQVRLSARGQNSSVGVFCDGIVTLESENDITINSSKRSVQNVLNDSGEIEKTLEIAEGGLLYRDDKGNQFKVQYEEGKIIHNQGKHPIPKGDELKSQLNLLNNKFNRLMDLLMNIEAVPGDGGTVILTALKTGLRSMQNANFENINSEKSFID